MLCKREPSPERPAHSRAAQASAWQPQCAAPSPAQMDIKTVAIYSKEDFNSVHRCNNVQTAPRVLSAPSHPCRPSRKDQGGRGLSGGAGQVACRRIPVGGGDCADRKGLQRAEIRMREQRAESRLSAAVLHRRTTSTPSTQARDKTRRRPGSTAFVLRLCFLFRLRLLERGPVCRRVDAQPHRHCLLHA